MKLLISIVIGILGYAIITALTAAAIAVTFNVQYTDVVHCAPFIAVSVFLIIPAAVAVAEESNNIITNYFNN
jgi:hypothetical protein